MGAINIYVNICSNVCVYWVSNIWVGFNQSCLNPTQHHNIYMGVKTLIIVIWSIILGAYLSVFVVSVH